MHEIYEALKKALEPFPYLHLETGGEPDDDVRVYHGKLLVANAWHREYDGMTVMQAGYLTPHATPEDAAEHLVLQLTSPTLRDELETALRKHFPTGRVEEIPINQLTSYYSQGLSVFLGQHQATVLWETRLPGQTEPRWVGVLGESHASAREALDVLLRHMGVEL